MPPQLEPYFAQVEASKQAVAAAEAQLEQAKAQLKLHCETLVEAVVSIYGPQ